MKYDKTGAAFELDHVVNGISYVRPMIKVVTQSTAYDDYEEFEDYEPADYLVARKASDLFDAPPVQLVNAEIEAKRAELKEHLANAKREKSQAEIETRQAVSQLQQAKRALETWMSKHTVMVDLGRLLDGEVLYPLSVKENPYHHARDIPRIPTMRNAKYLAIHSGNFEKGQKWVCKKYGIDRYGTPFKFFATEEERASEIKSEFEKTCEHFRKKPVFGMPSHTTTTRLSYETLQEWVKTHPTLEIPADIETMRTDWEADQVRQKRKALAAQLAKMDATK